MEIQKCSDFINEAKATKVPKNEIRDALLDMFKKKPLVTKPDSKFKYPDEKGLYSLAGIKQYLSKYKDVDNTLGELQDDDTIDLKTTRVKNHLYKGDYIVYWYIGIDKDEVEKIKDKYEKEQIEKNKNNVKSAIKPPIKEEPKAKKPVEKAERKAGSPIKKNKKKNK